MARNRATDTDVAHLDEDLASALMAGDSEAPQPQRRKPQPKLRGDETATKKVVCVVDNKPWGIVHEADAETGEVRFIERPLKHKETAAVRADVADLMEAAGQVVIV
jgi:hypothetical protein